MKLGFIGLGKMGQNMVTRLLEKGFEMVVFNRTRSITDSFKNEQPKVEAPDDLAGLIKALPSPRVIWLMVSAGKPVDDVIGELFSAGLAKGDTLIDGGNSFYRDSIRREESLKEKGVNFIDCGTSGGLWGGRNGASLMLGGDRDAVEKLDPLWQALAAPQGYAYFGQSGAGHFIKMIHNGIEYGIDEALGEGFEILSKGPYQLDLAKVAGVWNHGSVIRGWLMELLEKELDNEPGLHDFSGKVFGGQTGEWALEAAHEVRVEAPVLEKAIEARKKSETAPTFTSKVVSALRKGYGGHTEAKASE